MRCYTEEDWERWRQLGIANHEAERRLEADARRRWAEVDAQAAKAVQAERHARQAREEAKRFAVQRQVQDAEQLHRQARRAVRQRVKDAAKREAERVAEAAQWKEAQRLAQLAPVRPYQVPETYGLNYRETAADEAYYREAIEPYTWR